MSRFAKKKIADGTATIELNIMPFIDVFSLLCTFLLFSAVFVSVGIHVVQVPFLSNAAPSTEESKRTLKVTVDVSMKTIEVTSSYTEAPIDKKKIQFPNSSEGVLSLHSALVGLRVDNPEADKVDLFLDDNIEYNEIIKLLDSIKLRNENDPVIPTNPKLGLSSGDLFPKVVFGSVIL